MKNIFTIFRKELKDTLRDRRTLMTMLVVPLVIYPVLMVVVSEVSASQQKKSQVKKVEIGYFDHGQTEELLELIEKDTTVTLKKLPEDLLQNFDAGNAAVADTLIRGYVRDGYFDGFLWVKNDFDTLVKSGKAGGIGLYYNTTKDDGLVRQRLNAKLEFFKEGLLERRFEAAGLDRGFAQGIDVQEQDMATVQEQIGKIVGGILPYFFIIFTFLGSMYPAIDLAAGEKERGTIETILTTPATKLEILMGKMGVVVLTGLISAGVFLIGILVAIEFVDFLPPELLDVLYGIIQWESVLLLLLILLPLSIFFAGFLLSLSIYSRSFKEAQSMITPLIILIILPAMLGMLPGVKLNFVTAMVPILNVSLVTKDIVSGTLNALYYIEALISLLILAAITMAFSIYWFGKESNILRG